MGSEQIVGQALASVLPKHQKSWFRIPHLLHLNFILLVPLLSPAVGGYDGSLMNGLQALPSWKFYFRTPQGQTMGVVNAAQSIGSVLALPLAGFISDRFGRKKTLLCGVITVIIASAIQTGAVNLGMFIFSRVLVGMGTILVVQPSPMLISELCYPTHRGKYTSLYYTFFYLGSVVAAWCTYGAEKNLGSSDWAWRGPSLAQAGFSIIQLIMYPFLPESPRWLIANGYITKAREILARFHAGGDSNHPLVEFEMQEITTGISSEHAQHKTSWSSMVDSPGKRKRLLITISLGIYSQWCGSSVVSYYLPLVLESVGIEDPKTQTLINGCLQLFNFFAGVMAAFLVDYLGRRALWNWGGIGMLVSFVIWTACSALFDQNSQNNSAGMAVIAFIFIYYFHYDIAYSVLILSYPTEILPYSMRSKGLSIELGVIYGSLIVLSFLNPIAMASFGWKWYLLFCVILVISIVTNWILLPETKGRSLEEIAELFGDSTTEVIPSEKENIQSEVSHVEEAEVVKEGPKAPQISSFRN
ncbi:general substrate transporter [Penicillium soppii]|uniref:general substrate transporter n=1 Tax=Penicillium soppii TaxID=69789 RepID=UPI002549A969|nr:general substrate transporter [Penicillium soppii]KAJ5881343.1 general substrate transporter [Penicillium soppii]